MHLQERYGQILGLQSGDCVLFDFKNRNINFLRDGKIFFTISGDNRCSAEKKDEVPWLHFYQAQSFMHIVSFFCGYRFTEQSRTDSTVQYRLLPQKRQLKKQTQ